MKSVCAFLKITCRTVRSTEYAREPDGTTCFLYVSSGIEHMNGVRVADVLADASVLYRQISREYRRRMLEAQAKSAADLFGPRYGSPHAQAGRPNAVDVPPCAAAPRAGRPHDMGRGAKRRNGPQAGSGRGAPLARRA